MVKLALSLILACVVESTAATYYVRKDGSNANPGTADNTGGAWLTIQWAASHSALTAGDSVHVRAGTYQEYVVFSKSGASGNLINWYGERDGSGNWLTIIDPSETISGGWSAAGEIGANVWKRTFTDYVPTTLIADGYVVPKFSHTPSQLATAASALMSTDTWNNQPFWGGVEAGWGSTSGVVYLRFRDNSEPTAHTIRVSDNGTGQIRWNATKAALLANVSYNRISGFAIRGTEVPLLIRPTAAGNYVGNIMESNHVSLGYGQILLSGGATNAANVSSNIVRHNYLTQRGYWETAGIRGGAQTGNVGGWENYRIYLINKNSWYVQSSGLEAGLVNLISVRDGNVVHGNVLSNGVHGVRFHGAQTGDIPTGNTVSSNQLANLSGGPWIWNAVGDLSYLHDNKIRNAWMGWGRFQNTNVDRSGQNRVYVYRNDLWNPPGLGHCGYIHFAQTNSFQSEIWWYHNSFEGGASGLSIGWTSLYGPTSVMGGLRMANNILSCPAPFDSRVGYMGLVSRNRLRASASGWPNNLVSGTWEWGGASSSITAPDFTLVGTSIAVDTGADLTAYSLPDTGVADSLPDMGAIPFNPTPLLPQVSLTASASQVFERGSPVTIYIRRTGSTASNLSGTWTITGTATNGVQCATMITTWLIDAGQTQEEVTLTPRDDGFYTGPLEFEFTVVDDDNLNVAGGSLVIRFNDSFVNPEALRGPYFPGQGRPPT